MRLFLFLLLLVSCKQTAPVRQLVRLNFHSEPSSLDPRLVRDIPTMTTSKMLYDGLMRMTAEGPICSLAESYKKEGLRYTFTLRQALWTDGSLVTAQDFERSWKSVLDPSFPAEFAYHLDMVDFFWAADAQTFVVQLKQEQPYFLELVAQPICYAVKGEESNGPFRLVRWEHGSELVVEKNPLYWDAAAVQLEGIVISMIEDEHTELNMYENGELDWAGSPNSSIPPEALPSLKERGDLYIEPIAGTFSYKFNTQAAPFHNRKLRQAFALAINRRSLVDDILQAGQIVAKSLVPPCMQEGLVFPLLEKEEGDRAMALVLFEEALNEEGWTRETMPPVTLSFSKSEKTQKTAQAIQQEWNETFGIAVKLQSYEWNVFIDRLSKRNYQVGGRGCVVDLSDPLSLLALYRECNDERLGGNNDTGWESADYVALLDTASSSVEQRERYLQEAEALLLEDLPLVPLYHSTACYLKRAELQQVYLSKLCDLDFKYAHFN